jgi:hypothetical protein
MPGAGAPSRTINDPSAGRRHSQRGEDNALDQQCRKILNFNVERTNIVDKLTVVA